jgi:hypothetical protein
MSLCTSSAVVSLPDCCCVAQAYINAIRRAQHFIYIENQYFLGSSHVWAQDRHAGGCQALLCLRLGHIMKAHACMAAWHSCQPVTARCACSNLAASSLLPGQLARKQTCRRCLQCCGAGTGANHLVCIELALKIVQKINAGQRFMAYILLPLFPEGDP